MWKAITMQIARILIQKIINYLVAKAEYKFRQSKQGQMKKAYVTKELDAFIESNPEYSNWYRKNNQKISDLIEKSVTKKINN